MTTNKNIVLTVNIDDPRHQFPPSLYAEYSINTWKSWCKKNNVDFKQIDVSVQQYDIAKWNKLCVFDVVEPHHEKIALVDCDTMIKWDAPNFFDSYDDEFCGVVDDGNIGWVKNSINIYKEFFPNQKLEPLEYINSGVMFFTKEHTTRLLEQGWRNRPNYYKLYVEKARYKTEILTTHLEFVWYT